MLCTYFDLEKRSGIPLSRIVQAIQTGALTHQGFLIDDEEPRNATALEALRADSVGAPSVAPPEKSRKSQESGPVVGPPAQFRPSKKPRATPVIERAKTISKSQGDKT